MSNEKLTNKAQNPPLSKGAVSGSLPMYDVLELNILVTKFNNGEMSLYDFVGNVWNEGYRVGYDMAVKSNDR
jgi:hypothetical protein